MFTEVNVNNIYIFKIYPDLDVYAAIGSFLIEPKFQNVNIIKKVIKIFIKTNINSFFKSVIKK